METTRLHAAERPLALAAASGEGPLQADVEAFVETLRREHQRFLAAVGDAGARLGKDAAALANTAALHARLTRQFLDAQRTILCRHAQTDAEVARIEREAEAGAATLMANARRRVAAMSEHPACGLPGVVMPPAVLLAPAIAPAVDTAALAEIVDQVFQPREADGVTARRQLTELLDSWWASEQQEARAKIDDASARAAVRRHQAGLEAAATSASIVAAAPYPPVGDGFRGVAPLPTRMVEILDAAGTTDLDGLFESLLASLEVPTAVSMAIPVLRRDPSAAPLAEGAIIRFEPSPVIPAKGSDEAFERFWAKEPVAPSPARRARWWHHAVVVVPATVVSSLLVAALAWVG